MRRAIAVALVGCGPADPADVTGDECVADVVLTTTDYAVGALATVSADPHCVRDEIVPTSGDPVVRAAGDTVYQLNRLGTDSMRVHRGVPLDSVPVAELTFEPGSNPRDVAEVDGRVFVALYESDHLAVVDPITWTVTGQVDLSEHADEDGLPEADTMAVLDGRLFVALQRYRRDDGWTSTAGRIVEVDPATHVVVAHWETGPSPVLHATEAGLWVRTGAWFLLDGALAPFDPDDGPGPARWTEEQLGWELVDVALLADGGAFVIGYTAEGEHLLACASDTGEPQVLEYTTAAPWSVVADDAGRAWVAIRSGWLDPTAGGGLALYDIVGCAPVVDDWIRLSLEPFSMAVR